MKHPFIYARLLQAVLLLCKLCLLQGCGSHDESVAESTPMALYVEPSNFDFSENPELLKRILSSPHGYFRFINIIFSNEVCHRFADLLDGTPSFNLHGDAHLEQYAITDLGHGLTDFDDSSTGPAIIDLMRLGVSMHLACEQRGWQDKIDLLFDRFLSGYRAALADYTIKAPEPALVKRLQTEFTHDREAYLNWIDSITDEIAASERDSVKQAMLPYIRIMKSENQDLDEDFFEIADVRNLKLGIGSALDIKYLARIRGMTSEALDDVMLEIKQVRDLTGIDCIVTQQSDPFRILIGQARIAYDPYKYLGYIRLGQNVFWVHAWVDNYKELQLGKTAKSVEELAEVVYDIGIQLGRGHTNQIAAPLGSQLRLEQARLLSEMEGFIKMTCEEMANETILAWQKFCAVTSRGNQ